MNDEAIELGRRAAARLRLLPTQQFATGLTDAEFSRIEDEFGFGFADDHRAFLAAGLPVGSGFPNWRDGDRETLRSQLAWPVDGTLFDVEHNAFWHDTWGGRPTDLAEALTIARERLADVPVMVPVYVHRYLPAGRGTYGHPVLSMYQTDIIYYGSDLADYIGNEFAGADHVRTPPVATVEFWREFLD
ncbi:hypothetical protein ACIA49_39765 [Kribbella sp. NPDC051587]|uniref:hypothetical protein n=1 Tax=Kribbella sp. NPDC051587 TaxID=3364119 RepID=UPI0037913C4E